MSKLTTKPCPLYQLPFLLRCRNQRYWSDKCCVGANNAVARERYATAKQGTSQLEALRQQVQHLKQQRAALTHPLVDQPVVIRVVKESKDILLYGGRRYKRGTLVGRADLGVGRLMPGNTILYPDDSARNTHFTYLLQL